MRTNGTLFIHKSIPRRRNGVKTRIQKTRLSILLVFVLSLTTAVAASAAVPQALHIEVLEYIGTSGEDFSASGAAVDSGAVCDSGTVDDLVIDASASGAGTHTILRVLKRFYCGDASGTFDVKMTVLLDNESRATTASWRFADGTGDYVGLHGNGSLVGTPLVKGFSIFDVYDGMAY
jgi:hypothetical protein